MNCNTDVNEHHILSVFCCTKDDQMYSNHKSTHKLASTSVARKIAKFDPHPRGYGLTSTLWSLMCSTPTSITLIRSNN